MPRVNAGLYGAGGVSRQVLQPESRRTNELNPTHREEMTYRTPTDVKEEFRTQPRRALILTSVVHESRAVKAHLTDPEILIGEKGTVYTPARGGAYCDHR